MLNIQTTIHSDSEGNYKAKDIISQLVNANLGIEIPNKPLSEICLADLKCEGLPYVYSHTEGTVWDNELCTYTERKITLCFG
jgi:hypothetical protein|nr:MAG TPA: hypothetical protein [Bacteriophage sp.]